MCSWWRQCVKWWSPSSIPVLLLSLWSMLGSHYYHGFSDFVLSSPWFSASTVPWLDIFYNMPLGGIVSWPWSARRSKIFTPCGIIQNLRVSQAHACMVFCKIITWWMEEHHQTEKVNGISLEMNGGSCWRRRRRPSYSIPNHTSITVRTNPLVKSHLINSMRDQTRSVA